MESVYTRVANIMHPSMPKAILPITIYGHFLSVVSFLKKKKKTSSEHQCRFVMKPQSQ